MELFQKEIILKPRPRGFHLITEEIYKQLEELNRFETGIANLLIKHTSAALSLNENADPDVRHDMELIFNGLIPEMNPDFRHTLEGADDMPAHAKSSVIGTTLTLPVKSGRFNLGTWQGIYLCEHRNHPSPRRVVVTLMGNNREN